MKKKVAIIAALIMSIACLGLSGCGSSETSDDMLKVTCHNGVMLGQEENGVNYWKGIPYAEPPVGDLRWKAPVPAAESSEEIECYEYGLTALQYEWPTERASYADKGEDCLTLNIWTGSEAGDEAKPVMFWIHGGSYAWGGSTDPIYDGQKFAEAHPEVILITCNYRLGLMAFPEFSTIPGGEEYTDTNLAIRDHIVALEWVKDNIEGFGGDPDNVTIFGESAGSVSTSSLLLSPAAEGLFDKCIVQSTTFNQGFISDRSSAQEYGELIAETVGAENMDDLLAVTEEEWLEIDTEYWLGDYAAAVGLVGDDEIIPSDFDEAVKRAGDSGVELLIGTNADEDYYSVHELEGYDNWADVLDEEWNDTYESVTAETKSMMDSFMETQKAEGKDRVFAESEFNTEGSRYSAIQLAEKYNAAGGTSYMYYWDVPSTSEDYFKGACHAVELNYIFNNLQDTIYSGENPDKATAEKAQESWINFAKTGNPSVGDLEWPEYDGKSRNTMMIELDGWRVEKDPMKDQRIMYEHVMKDMK